MSFNLDKIGCARHRWFTQFVIFVIVFNPIFAIYGYSGGLALDTIATVFLFGLYIIYGYKKTNLPNHIKLYFCYAWLISALSLNSIMSFFPLGLIMKFINFILLFGLADYGCLFGMYRKAGLVILVFFFLQNIVLFSIGYHISGFIPFLPIALTNDISLFIENHLTSTRFSAFFSEPAHLAQFLLVWLCLELYSGEKKGIILMIIIALLLSQSGNAMLGLFVVCFVYFKDWFFKNITIKKIIISVIITFVFGVGIYYYVSTEIGAAVLQRGADMQNNDLKVGSTYERLYRGYDIFENMPVWNKIVGIGDKTNLIHLFDKLSGVFNFVEGDTYLNGISSILIHCGFVGLILFFCIVKNIWKSNTSLGRLCILLLVLFMLMSSTYFDSLSAILFYISYCEKNKMKQLNQSPTIITNAINSGVMD